MEIFSSILQLSQRKGSRAAVLPTLLLVAPPSKALVLVLCLGLVSINICVAVYLMEVRKLGRFAEFVVSILVVEVDRTFLLLR